MKLLIADLRAKQRLYAETGPTPGMLKVLLSDGTLANVLFRVMSALATWRLEPVALLFHLLNKWINGCVIGVRASFGPGFILIHPIGVVINSKVRGGANVWIESGVVIGANHGKCPSLGDNIFIGSGAKIIGGVRLGTNAKVGANAVVLHDVAEGSTVVGIPARPLI